MLSCKLPEKGVINSDRKFFTESQILYNKSILNPELTLDALITFTKRILHAKEYVIHEVQHSSVIMPITV